MISVARLGVTPVKALAMLAPDTVFLEHHGVAENRRFYLVDEHGGLVNGRQSGALAQVRAACDPDATQLTLDFPNAARVESRVRLAETLETDFWGRSVTGRVCEGPWAAALSDRAGQTVRLVRAERAGDACDFYPLTLVSTASLYELVRRGGATGLGDGRRFRMLLTLDGCRPHEEDEWQGRRLRVGEATIRVGRPVPRCVITTLNPDTGDRDLDTLRAIKDYRGLSDGRTIDFGVYGEVEEPGRVRVGDSVAPVP